MIIVAKSFIFLEKIAIGGLEFLHIRSIVNSLKVGFIIVRYISIQCDQQMLRISIIVELVILVDYLNHVHAFRVSLN